MKRLEKDIEEIEQKKEKKYFKGSKDLIEELTALFGDLGDFPLSYELLKEAKNEDEKEAFAEEMVKDYLLMLDASIALYKEFQEFIDVIQNKRMFKFIKMLD